MRRRRIDGLGRLLQTELEDPYSNVALEEAIYRELKAPTLRVWEDQKCVVIGRAQLAKFETDLGYCRRHSIPVVRRFTAGGAVYHGPGNLNWSFFLPLQDTPRGKDPRNVFASFAERVVQALKTCGVLCEFTPPNSIVSREGKICGMAAYISKEKVLCHGTLLVGADLKELARVTTPRREGLHRRYTRSRSVKVANCGVGRRDFVRELVKGSREEFRPGSPTHDERDLCQRLVPRYRSERWNLGDPFELDDL
jgi:lipoate---protein ligase